LSPLQIVFLKNIETALAGFPTDGLTTNCIAVGFLPSDGSAISPRYTLTQTSSINSALGAKSSTYGLYAQIRESPFDGNQLFPWIEDIKASGAVFVASIMPSIPLSRVTPSRAREVASVLKRFTDEGIVVWLRFAHEVNWYLRDGTYKGNAAEFLTAWKNMYNTNCKDNPMVKCFWSPNRASNVEKDIGPFWPGRDFVDIVGIDCYPASDESTADPQMFDHCYKRFYDTYSAPYDLPFAIGETGAGNGQKVDWLKQLVSQETHAKYPNYVSLSWFEFDKEADFRVVMTDQKTLQETKNILLDKAGACESGGGASPTLTPTSSSMVPQPTIDSAAPQATCDWGYVYEYHKHKHTC
jgi:hypothetical protein